MRSSSIFPGHAAAAIVALLVSGALACGGDGEPDAYGNFEATEVVVAAQTSGPVQRFLVSEGQHLKK